MPTPGASEVRRWAAMTIAATGVLLCARWILVHPDPSALHPDFVPLLVAIAFKAIDKMPMVGAAGLWLVAAASLAACTLSVYLALKSHGGEAASRLSIALACGGLPIAYFYLVLPYPVFGRPASELPLSALMAADTVALGLWFLSMWYLVRVWRIFPQAITLPDWERHVAAFLSETRSRMRGGWRARFYPEKTLHDAYFENAEDKEGLGRLLWSLGNAKERARGFDLVDSPWVVATFVVAAVFCAALQAGLRLEVATLAADVRPRGALALAGAMGPLLYFFVLGAGGAALSYAYLEYHRRWGTDEDRRRIAWVYATVFVAGVFFLAMMLGVFGFFTLAVFLALESLGDRLGDILLLPFALGLPLFGLACVIALVLSVAYRGDIDPRHGARRLTVWGLLAIVVAVLFVLLERAVAIQLAKWMSLPAEWGPILAGALVAATVAPIRGATEKAVNRLVTRYLPADFIASGGRRTCAIALCDLSGYTALSGVDQHKALLHAALLQQKAARISAARGGRVVKSMGDAVLMEFSAASGACAAMLDLHEQLPAAAHQVGLDPLPLHSGAHYGEVVVGPDDDVYGQTVNIAARLQGQASDGQIVVSDVLAHEARLEPGRLQPLGARPLKNVPEPVACHLLLREASAALEAHPVAQLAAIPR